MKEKHSIIFPSGSWISKFGNFVALSTQTPDTPLQSDWCPLSFKQKGDENCSLFPHGPAWSPALTECVKETKYCMNINYFGFLCLGSLSCRWGGSTDVDSDCWFKKCSHFLSVYRHHEKNKRWLSKADTVLVASENYGRGVQHCQGHRFSAFSERNIISSNFVKPS